MDSTEVTMLSVEAVGEVGLPQAQTIRCQTSIGLEHSQIGAGPWRLSKSPALYYALPNRYFRDLGLPALVA